MKQSAGLTGLNRPTVSRYFRLFRMRAPEIKEKLTGQVILMNDSYFGGRRKGKKGRRAVGKTLFLGLLD